MRLPRIRFTIRLMMVSVAALAVALALLMRPYPIAAMGFGPTNVVYWSNGSSTHQNWRQAGPARWEKIGPLVRVVWSDGSWSLHFQRHVRLFSGSAKTR